ncbi:MAG: SsrA-binding protein SmpB [Candidatus Omnitrophica bacterium]|nr:SsrA-binding protein SmpB [Candidatus Omnitrophota bacterium]
MSNIIATNKKAFRDYFLSDDWECGIALVGAEVKSIRAGLVDFKDSFARIEDAEIFLHNLHIGIYEQAGYIRPEPDRPRKLLLHKKEIKKIVGKTSQHGFALIPTKIYLNARGFVKVVVALGKGKKHYDKRESIKKQTIARDIGRAVRNSKG